HRFERSCDRRSVGGHANRSTGLTHGCQSGSNGQLPSNEVCAARCAAGFGIVVREHHAFCCKLIQLWSSACHHASMIGADVKPPDVISHDEHDVRHRIVCHETS